jgi:hypothetical protein
MRTFLVALLLLLTCPWVLAQKTKRTVVPLVADKWTYTPAQVEFTTQKGEPVMHIMPGAGKVLAKDLDFSSGTIEFDVKPKSITFYFRMQDEKETECFYFRLGKSNLNTATDALQYAPYLDGVLMWNTFGYYQSNAPIKKEEWNHVKLVVSGSRMRMYVNRSDQPTLEVDQLEGNTTHGRIGFEGDMLVSNLVVKPNEVEGLSPLPGTDPTHHDPRYIRSWAVSEPLTMPGKVDFSYDFLPDPQTRWQVLETERRGLVNLTRTFGKSQQRRIAWLNVTIESAVAQKKKVDFGFIDDVWVFLNGKIAYVDKNLEGRPIAKSPDGRLSIENTSFVLPLKKGPNELLIGVANDFFGWGVIARLEDMDDIDVSPDPTFDSRLVPVAQHILDTYIGTYRLPNGQAMQVSKEDHGLKISGENFITALIYPQAENRFFLRDFDLQVEFVQDTARNVSECIFYSEGQPVLQVKRVP